MKMYDVLKHLAKDAYEENIKIIKIKKQIEKEIEELCIIDKISLAIFFELKYKDFNHSSIYDFVDISKLFKNNEFLFIKGSLEFLINLGLDENILIDLYNNKKEKEQC